MTPPTAVPSIGAPGRAPPASPSDHATRVGDLFTISGDLREALEPGASAALELTLRNPGDRAIVVTGLGVAVGSITAPAGARDACTTADFSVRQFVGSVQLALPPRSTRTLGELGLDSARWPSITMLNRPVDQEGCKGVTLRLVYTGTARTR